MRALAGRRQAHGEHAGTVVIRGERHARDHAVNKVRVVSLSLPSRPSRFIDMIRASGDAPVVPCPSSLAAMIPATWVP